MKRLELFFKGMFTAIKNSWFLIAVLTIATIAGVIGVGFCYRLTFFDVRQPEYISYYKDKAEIAYTISGMQKPSLKVLEVDGEKIFALASFFDQEIQGETYVINGYVEDANNEKFISNEDFRSDKKIIVLNEEVQVEVNEKVAIIGEEFLVVGKTPNNSYIPYQSVANFDGFMQVYVNSQISRKAMGQIEELIGAKMYRDGNYKNSEYVASNGGVILEPSRFMFLAIGIIILLISSTSIFKLFSCYMEKNKDRYNVYKQLGMKSTATNFTVIMEGCIITFFNLAVALLVDGLGFRQMTKMGKFFFLYDIYDILILFGLFFVSYLAGMLIKIAKLTVQNKTRRMRKRKVEYEKA